MEEYVSNTTWSEVARRIDAAQRIALCTHSRPDGDALGSALAIVRARPRGRGAADIFIMGPVEGPLIDLAGATPLRRVEEQAPDDDYDLILVLDTGAWSQLEPLADWLRRHRDRAICIDHHARGDDVAACRIVDSGAAATALMVATLLDELGWPLVPGTTDGAGNAGESAAEAIFLGLASDTGWFRYSNAGADAYALAARLLGLGVDKSRIYRITEETYRPERLALEARALASIEYACDGTVAIQSLGLQDFEETGGGVEDLTGIVNLPMIVGGVYVAILLAEAEPSRTKMSFRAKPGFNGREGTNVNELATKFGGGGHVFAAGARMDVGLEEAKAALRKVLEE